VQRHEFRVEVAARSGRRRFLRALDAGLRAWGATTLEHCFDNEVEFISLHAYLA
jgi:hypothetical protein